MQPTGTACLLISDEWDLPKIAVALKLPSKRIAFPFYNSSRDVLIGRFHSAGLFFCGMPRGVSVPKKPIKIEIIQEGDQRFLAKSFSDGSEERLPIVKQPAKSRRPGPYRYRDMNKGRKKGF